MHGVYSVLPTPFTSTSDIDGPSLRKVVDLAIAAGVDGVTPSASPARWPGSPRRNAARWSTPSSARSTDACPSSSGPPPRGSRTCIEYTRQAKAAGAARVMVSPPRMPKLNSDAVVRHYAALADAVDIPIVVQDYPPISGFAMEPWLLARIAREVPAARTIKLEDPPTPFKTARILGRGRDLEVEIFGGLGGVFLLEELLAGAAGAMTGFAYPEALVEIVSRFKRATSMAPPKCSTGSCR